MEHKKSEDSEVYTFYPEVKPSYKQLLKAFSEIYAEALDSFKKISLRRKHISKFKKDINDLNSSLDSLKEEYSSLIDDRFSISNTLVENIDYVICPILKF